jgi:hypothetical protein
MKLENLQRSRGSFDSYDEMLRNCGREFAPLLFYSKVSHFLSVLTYMFFLFVSKGLVTGTFDVLSVYRVLILSDNYFVTSRRYSSTRVDSPVSSVHS